MPDTEGDRRHDKCGDDQQESTLLKYPFVLAWHWSPSYHRTDQ